MKIIDSFLFFQEYDLLEIRLKYLDSLVDFFVIFEASQTFSGVEKIFNFEINQDRFKDYKDKILYFKFDHNFKNYSEVIKFLNSESEVCRDISKILDDHDFYPKTNINWVLDSLHRECLYIPLDLIASADDLVLFSDIDEIPSKEFFKVATEEKIKPVLAAQREFFGSLNRYKRGDWSGTISARWSYLRGKSLNVLRRNALKQDSEIYRIVNPGGYHFTSCSSIEGIKDKIKAYGHQEFNNFITLSFIALNMSYGKDIFWRNGISYDILKDDTELIDKEMGNIIKDYPHLICLPMKKSVWIDLVLKLAKFTFRLVRKVKFMMGMKNC